MNNKSKNNTYIANNKGISLIVLIITIIVALIIITTVIMLSTSEIDDASTNTFATNLMSIQDATESYYIANNEMPSLDGSTVMSKDDLITIARVQDVLLEEITENNDLDSQFYKIDLAKIEITKVPYGNNELGNSDIFVVAYPSMNAYYPYGLDISGETYCSITSKISDVTKTPSNQPDMSTTSVISSGGIKVTKTNSWANKMGVSIEAQMGELIDNEKLYMSVSGNPNREILTTPGQNTFGFNLLSSIKADLETIKVSGLTDEEVAYIELGTKPLTDRYVDILKYKDLEIIGKVRIDLSNFSKTLPTITNATLSSYPTINTVNLVLASSESGIREVRYEYLKKYKEDGSIVNYNDSYSDFDATYMQSKARKVEMKSDLFASINAPKEVQILKIAVIDKAGNINLYNQEIAPRLFIGNTINSSTMASLQLTANMYSINGIKSITFSKSTDGLNFTDPQVYTLNTTTNGITTKQSSPYTDFAVNTAYIKMVAINYNSTITETRIVKVSLTSLPSLPGSPPVIVVPEDKPLLATGMTAKKWSGSSWVTVANPYTDSSWYNYTNKEWANAQTADGSMWVWIPRYEYKITTPHSATAQTIAINFLGSLSTPATSGYTIHPAFTFGSINLTGIWVAKFEASGSTAELDIKPGIASLRNVSISDMFAACRNMETSSRFGWGLNGKRNRYPFNKKCRMGSSSLPITKYIRKEFGNMEKS